MKNVFFLFLFFSISLFATQSLKISSNNIKVLNYGYFKTDENLSPSEALEESNKMSLSVLPETATSLGVDKSTYWFRFDISLNEEKEIFLEVKNPLTSNCEMFVFKNKTLLYQQTSGYNVPIFQRSVQIFPIRFKLESNKNMVYILKINSTSPLMMAFELGRENELNRDFEIFKFIQIATFSIFMIMLFYNLFLYFIIKDSIYLYYCFYIFTLYIWSFVLAGLVPLIFEPTTIPDMDMMIGICFILTHISATMFTINFLQLKKLDKNLVKILYVGLSLLIAMGVFFPFFDGIKPLSFITLYIDEFLLLYAGFSVYFSQNNKIAIFYLVATGVVLCASIVLVAMNQGGLLPYNIWMSNAISFGLIWDTLFLSFALAYRIKLLQEQKESLLKDREIKSKFTIIGETLGNIAHQWRQPLATINANIIRLEARLNYTNLTQIELEKSLSEIRKNTTHLFNTMETFGNYFTSNTRSDFNISLCIGNVVEFMQGQLEAYNIKLLVQTDKTINVNGNFDEFFHLLQITITNAIDEFVKNRVNNPQIVITQSKSIDRKITIIEIEDNAGGIKIHPIESIFEPYITNKGVNGFGIGLYSVKNIIDKMGGRIKAYNTRDGAKFVIELNFI